MRSPLFVISLFCLFTFALPNLAALIGRANHRVADLALERLREGGSVRERCVDAEAVERVRGGLDSQARGFGSNAPGPDLRPPQQETLPRREPRVCRRAAPCL